MSEVESESSGEWAYIRLLDSVKEGGLRHRANKRNDLPICRVSHSYKNLRNSALLIANFVKF